MLSEVKHAAADIGLHLKASMGSEQQIHKNISPNTSQI